MKKKSGEAFEKLAEDIFNKLKKFQNEYSVQHDVLLDSQFGKRQFDILIKHEMAGFEYFTAIECKDHKSKISIKEIDNFESKLRDVNIQKGILISRNGFSNSAISKAKNTNISLCTAHEALSENWKIDVELTIYINEVLPKRFSPVFTHKVVNTDDSISMDSLIINDIEIKEFFKNAWQNNELPIDFEKKLQKIKIPAFSPPYFITIQNKTEGTVKRKIEGLEFEVELDNNFFSIPLSELINTQVLKNITDNTVAICLDQEQLFNNQETQKISKKEFKRKRGLSLNILKKYQEFSYGESNASYRIIKNKV